jgi:hypothetical protein
MRLIQVLVIVTFCNLQDTESWEDADSDYVHVDEDIMSTSESEEETHL